MYLLIGPVLIENSADVGLPLANGTSESPGASTLGGFNLSADSGKDLASG